MIQLQIFVNGENRIFDPLILFLILGLVITSR